MIAATVTNAARLIELDSLDGGFGAWLPSHGDFERTVAALRREFRFLGDVGAYYFLWVVDEPVPAYEDWCRSRGHVPKVVG
jgi:hypothetical protein